MGNNLSELNNNFFLVHNAFVFLFLLSCSMSMWYYWSCWRKDTLNPQRRLEKVSRRSRFATTQHGKVDASSLFASMEVPTILASANVSIRYCHCPITWKSICRPVTGAEVVEEVVEATEGKAVSGDRLFYVLFLFLFLSVRKSVLNIWMAQSSINFEFLLNL